MWEKQPLKKVWPNANERFGEVGFSSQRSGPRGGAGDLHFYKTDCSVASVALYRFWIEKNIHCLLSDTMSIIRQFSTISSCHLVSKE